MGALPVPDALYGCSETGCCQEHTWPAHDLTWFSGREEGTDGDDLIVHAVEAGWYCPQCCEHLEIECDGPPLSEVLAARTAPGEPMPDDGALIHALNMAGDDPAALHEVARTMLAHMAGDQLLPAYDPDKPLEGDRAAFAATEIARRELQNPFALQAVTLSPPLATRIALELQYMSGTLRKAGKAAGEDPDSSDRVQSPKGRRKQAPSDGANMISVLGAGVAAFIVTISTVTTVEAWQHDRRWYAALSAVQAGTGVLLVAATTATQAASTLAGAAAATWVAASTIAIAIAMTKR